MSRSRRDMVAMLCACFGRKRRRLILVGYSIFPTFLFLTTGHFPWIMNHAEPWHVPLYHLYYVDQYVVPGRFSLFIRYWQFPRCLWWSYVNVLALMVSVSRSQHAARDLGHRLCRAKGSLAIGACLVRLSTAGDLGPALWQRQTGRCAVGGQISMLFALVQRDVWNRLSWRMAQPYMFGQWTSCWFLVTLLGTRGMSKWSWLSRPQGYAQRSNMIYTTYVTSVTRMELDAYWRIARPGVSFLF